MEFEKERKYEKRRNVKNQENRLRRFRKSFVY